MTTNSSTLLDHIYTNLNNNVESEILIYEITDHLPTFCSISSKPLRTKTKYKFRDMKSFDKEKFIHDISILEKKVNHRIHTQSDTEATVAFFIENFLQIVNKHAPLKESSRKETKLTRWQLQTPAYGFPIKLCRDPNVQGKSRVTSLLQLKKMIKSWKL